MIRHIIKLECRMSDTKVSGTRVQSSEEAKEAATVLERNLKSQAEHCVVGDPSVSVFRWKDTGAICNMEIGADIDVDRVSVDKADEVMRRVFHDLRTDRFRRG